MSDETKKEHPPLDSAITPGDQPERKASTGGSEADVEALRQSLAAMTAEAAENYDRFLRERAEIENFKRRMQREKGEALRFAGESLVRDLLPVLDNLERAIAHADSGGNGPPLVEGIRMVLKSALDVLERHGVTRVEAAGQTFDPAVHQAVAQVPDPEREPNQVVEQLLPGYALHERLLRPAQVTVSAKPPVEKGPADD